MLHVGGGNGFGAGGQNFVSRPVPLRGLQPSLPAHRRGHAHRRARLSRYIAGWPIIYIATCWTAAIGCRPINILASAISSTLPTQSILYPILYYVGYYILYNRNLFLIVFLYFSAPSFLIFCLVFDTIVPGCMHHRTTQAWISVWTFWTRAAVTFFRPCERWPSNRLMVSSWSALPTILRLSRSRYIRFLYSLASFFDLRPRRINQ